ncbi:MAG: class I SAM-dependent methyltransferase [Patescibacteria group bacterium]
MQHWLIKFFKHPREIGSIAPSSSGLGRLMTKNIPSSAKILELGPGDGAITQFIVPKLSNPSQLTLIESNQELAQICQNKFPTCNIITADAETILANDAQLYDFIISGIPFAGMHADKRNRLFNLIRNRLNDQGSFIMFQYSILTRGELKTIFKTVTTNFTFWNLPPAFVFTCKKNN